MCSRLNTNDLFEVVNTQTQVIKTTDSVTLLGITINDELNFYAHVSNLCKIPT